MPGASPGPHVRSPPSPPGGCLSFLVSPDFFPSVHTAPAVTLAFSGPPPSALQGAPPHPPTGPASPASGAHTSPLCRCPREPRCRSPSKEQVFSKVFYNPPHPVSLSTRAETPVSARGSQSPHRLWGAPRTPPRPVPTRGRARRLAFPEGVPVAPPTDGCAVTVPVSSSVPQLLLSTSLLPPSRRTAPACLG